ncbi:MAG: DUF3883 domain-containing protein [Brevundimonas sp.]|nr:MAG: DUF3883 domain-containing protein [Brevundimonas sp.]
MADESKTGTDWSAYELDVIVADYFAMLALDAAGEQFVKSRRAQALMAQIGRTHRSVEFKHMNISAVAEELGLPKVRGYKPKFNYQTAIFEAIDRYLDLHPEILADDAFRVRPVAEQRARRSRSGGEVLDAAPTFPGVFEDAAQFDGGQSGIRTLTLTEAPPPGPGRTPRPEEFARLVRKYDPAARDHRNRALGFLGEEQVFYHERAKLIAADRPDLARRIEWTSQERGDGAGYDVRSFEPTGAERLIEVKATRGGPTTPFYLTRREREVSLERPSAWRLYRIHNLQVMPSMFILQPPLESVITLEPETWRAGF